MTDITALIQDLRAHAPDAPEPCRTFMRDAAGILDRYKNLLGVAARGEDAGVLPPPFPPPPIGGKHRRPPAETAAASEETRS